MIEILYRGKCEDNGEWVEGVAFPGDDWSITICRRNPDDGSFDGDEVVPASVGCYTGLKDKNGTRIFEGDILKTKYGRLCKVEWFSSSCDACWDLTPVETNHKCPDKYDLWRSKNLEVIGNIYDNPELLEAKNGWYVDI